MRNRQAARDAFLAVYTKLPNFKKFVESCDSPVGKYKEVQQRVVEHMLDKEAKPLDVEESAVLYALNWMRLERDEHEKLQLTYWLDSEGPVFALNVLLRTSEIGLNGAGWANDTTGKEKGFVADFDRMKNHRAADLTAGASEGFMPLMKKALAEATDVEKAEALEIAKRERQSKEAHRRYAMAYLFPDQPWADDDAREVLSQPYDEHTSDRPELCIVASIRDPKLLHDFIARYEYWTTDYLAAIAERIGDAIVPMILTAKSQDAPAAAKVIAKFQSKEAVAALAKLLKCKDKETRREAEAYFKAHPELMPHGVAAEPTPCLRLDTFGDACRDEWRDYLVEQDLKGLNKLALGRMDGEFPCPFLEWGNADGGEQEVMGVIEADKNGGAFDVPHSYDTLEESGAMDELIAAHAGCKAEELEDLDEEEKEKATEKATSLFAMALDVEQRRALDEIREALKDRFEDEVEMKICTHDEEDESTLEEMETQLKKYFAKRKNRRERIVAALYESPARRRWLLTPL